MNEELSRRLIAEAVGTALLLAGVVGSGITADRLFAGQQGLRCWRTSARSCRE